jgi:hypothetical protein
MKRLTKMSADKGSREILPLEEIEPTEEERA